MNCLPSLLPLWTDEDCFCDTLFLRSSFRIYIDFAFGHSAGRILLLYLALSARLAQRSVTLVLVDHFLSYLILMATAQIVKFSSVERTSVIVSVY